MSWRRTIMQWGRERGLRKKDMPCKRDKTACKQGEKRWGAGEKARSCSFPPSARMNEGGRPYILERPPFYIGAAGRIRLFIPSKRLFLWSPWVDELMSWWVRELMSSGVLRKRNKQARTQTSVLALRFSDGCFSCWSVTIKHEQPCSWTPWVSCFSCV